MNRYEITLDKIPPYGVSSFHKGVLIGEPIRGNHFDPSPNSVHVISILSGNNRPMFDGADVHYYKKYFLCKKSICCEKLKYPKHRTACVLLIYGYNPKKMYGLDSYQILPWMFPLTIYKNLKMVHKTFPLNSFDLMIYRTNHDQFKNFEILVLGESRWQESEKADEVRCASLSTIKYLRNCIARDFSESEIVQLLGAIHE